MLPYWREQKVVLRIFDFIILAKENELICCAVRNAPRIRFEFNIEANNSKRRL